MVGEWPVRIRPIGEPEVARVLHRDKSVTGAAVEPSGPPDVTLRITPLADGAGLRITGEIDLVTRDEWAKALIDAAGSGDDLHLDLAGVTFIDVGGATALARTAMRLGDGRRIILHSPPSVLRSLLDLLWGPSPIIEVREP